MTESWGKGHTADGANGFTKPDSTGDRDAVIRALQNAENEGLPPKRATGAIPRTPTTEDVRASFVMRPDLTEDRQQALAWDRWYEAEKKKWKRQGWAEGFEAGEADVFSHEEGTWDQPCIQNPYEEQ